MSEVVEATVLWPEESELDAIATLCMALTDGALEHTINQGNVCFWVLSP